MNARILVVDDEKLIRWSLQERLREDGHEMREATDVASAIRLLKTITFDVALFDLKLPDGDGIELLRHAARFQPDLACMVITAHSSVGSAVEAMKAGAIDYVSKPFNMDEISLTVQRTFENRELRHTLNTELQQKKQRFGGSALIGDSPAFLQTRKRIERVAGSDAAVLLLGETGSGKDMAARAIHYESNRADKPFMNITCTAMPEKLIESELFGHEAGAFTDARKRKAGLFELAHQGTVFLDEIGDMPRNLQATLLRVLEEKTFRRIGGKADIRIDCRIIAATNRDLNAMIETGEFREDLYYRLSTVPISLPPLRERPEDIPGLAMHFLDQYRRRMNRDIRNFNTAAINRLREYSWPGNVRELRNTIERAVLLCDGGIIKTEDIFLGRSQTESASAAAGIVLPEEGCRLADVERELLAQALRRTGGNQTRAAALLGITRDQIRYKIEKHNMDVS
jgi:two-component system, NtrC family, response regulator AtoC